MNLIELVPRDLDELGCEAQQLLSRFSQLDGVNVPDILRQPIRSYQAAAYLLQKQIMVIPHIRTIDNPLQDTISLIKQLKDKGLTRVLLITGDMPSFMTKTYPVSPTLVVSKLKEQYPDLKIYCALDPYRQSFKKELQYASEKEQAGADGFFTQPFFDPDLARIYLEQLADSDIFLGISPVLSERSLHYWINKNQAIFPKDVDLSLDYNARLAKRLIQVATDFGQHSYMMPIKVPAEAFLEQVFS